MTLPEHKETGLENWQYPGIPEVTQQSCSKYKSTISHTGIMGQLYNLQ